MKHDKYLNIIQNKLTMSKFDIIDAIGICGIVIIQKEIYLKNNEVGEMIKNVFDLELPKYLIKSRTLMAARIIKILLEADDKQLQLYMKKLKLEILEKKEIQNIFFVKRNKSNENEKLQKWLKGLR